MRRGTAGALRLILPKHAVSVAAHRAAALQSSLQLEIYERDHARDSLEKIDPRRAGNINHLARSLARI